jgi:hypothetical protein
MSRFLGGWAALLLISSPSLAEAQRPSSGIYVGGSALADVKRFSSDGEARTLDGEGFGGGVTLGSSLADRWDVEVGVDVPGSTETFQERTIMLRQSAFTVRSRTRNRPVSVATLVRLRHGSRGRTELGYLAGLVFLRLRRSYDTLAPAGTPDALIPRPLESVDYASAPTVGVDARVHLGSRLSIVPAFHATVFRIQGINALVLRPRVGLRWTF